MTPVIRFGCYLSVHSPARQFALAQRVEALEFDSLWVDDHISFNRPRYESLTLLGAYASITRRLALGTAVYLLALRHPTVVAKITSTLDVLSGGRLILGVGVGGENPKEFEACGVPHRERGARVNEGIQVLRSLWAQTPASFAGRFVTFDGVSLDPKPAQHGGPRIWVGGRSDAALQRAGRLGDGWVSYAVTPDRYKRSQQQIFEAAHRAGRSPERMEYAHDTFITVGPSVERARATWVARLSRRYNQDFAPLADRYGVFGPPDRCVEQLARFVEAGCRHFLFDVVGEPEAEQEQLEMIASEIVPRFRNPVDAERGPRND